jgi:hypothetical protein
MRPLISHPDQPIAMLVLQIAYDGTQQLCVSSDNGRAALRRCLPNQLATQQTRAIATLDDLFQGLSGERCFLRDCSPAVG